MKRPALALALLLGVARLASAQTTPPIVGGTPATETGTMRSITTFGANAPLSGILDPGAYRLGPGDALVANVWGKISMTVPLEVGPDGAVFVPGRGSIGVSDLTLAEARQRIENLLRSQYRGVNVEVRLVRVRSFFVYRTGEVKEPGPVLAQGSSRIVDLLPDSIFTPEASRRNIEVRHRDGTFYVYDLQLFQSAGIPQPSEALGGGDVIYVPRKQSRIGAWGGVSRPGLFEMGPRDSLTTLLQMAGGLRPEALPDRALVVRWTDAGVRESLWVSVDSIRTRATNFPLRHGDNLYVPYDPEFREVHQVTLVGQVQNSGDYPIAAGSTRLTDLIDAAGGFRPEADLSALRLIRVPNAALGKEVEFDRLSRLPREQMTETEYDYFQTQLAALHPDFRIEWARVKRGDPALDPLLADGDVIRVERTSNTVRVDGQVLRPGMFDHRPGRNADYYLKLAGGPTSRAARSKIRVTRTVNGQTVSANEVRELSPGDFVWVPERPDKSAWDQLRDLVTVAAQVATIVIAVRR